MFDLIFIKGSSYQMGCDTGDINEQPGHNVRVRSFLLGKHPVTQNEWLSIVGNLPKTIYNKNENYPITEISWFQVIDFCNILSLKSGLSPCYIREGYRVLYTPKANGFRIPTEAEWEYAAKGGLKSNSFLYSGSNNLTEVAWYVSNSEKKIHKVCQKKGNELGIYDMSGNIYEFCWDIYDDYTSDDQDNPIGPNSLINNEQVESIKAGSKKPPRVMRGGNCFGLPYRQRNSSRYKYQYAGFTHDFIGFRLARNAE